MKNTVSQRRKKSDQNKFIRNNAINYIRYSTPSELKFDLLIPFWITLFLTVIVALIIPSPRDFVAMILELNSIVITIIAILAGFNTASLAIIASVNNQNFTIEPISDNENIPQVHLNTLQRLKNLIFNNPPQKELEAFVSFFAYAVISQLIIIVISLIINFLLTSLLKLEGVFTELGIVYKYLMIIPFSSLWIFLVLHSIFLSIRNIDMISHFIKFNSD